MLFVALCAILCHLCLRHCLSVEVAHKLHESGHDCGWRHHGCFNMFPGGSMGEGEEFNILPHPRFFAITLPGTTPTRQEFYIPSSMHDCQRWAQQHGVRVIGLLNGGAECWGCSEAVGLQHDATDGLRGCIMRATQHGPATNHATYTHSGQDTGTNSASTNSHTGFGVDGEIEEDFPCNDYGSSRHVQLMVRGGGLECDNDNRDHDWGRREVLDVAALDAAFERLDPGRGAGAGAGADADDPATMAAVTVQDLELQHVMDDVPTQTQPLGAGDNGDHAVDHIRSLLRRQQRTSTATAAEGSGKGASSSSSSSSSSSNSSSSKSSSSSSSSESPSTEQYTYLHGSAECHQLFRDILDRHDGSVDSGVTADSTPMEHSTDEAMRQHRFTGLSAKTRGRFLMDGRVTLFEHAAGEGGHELDHGDRHSHSHDGVREGQRVWVEDTLHLSACTSYCFTDYPNRHFARLTMRVQGSGRYGYGFEYGQEQQCSNATITGAAGAAGAAEGCLAHTAAIFPRSPSPLLPDGRLLTPCRMLFPQCASLSPPPPGLPTGRYAGFFHNATGVVVGSAEPWAEATLLAAGVRQLTTVEYTPISVQGNDKAADKGTGGTRGRLSAVTPVQLAQQYLRNDWDPVDFVFSYSTVEHSGLGRYGEHVDPDGDVEAMAMAKCLMRPPSTATAPTGATHAHAPLLFLGVPIGPDALVFDRHRIYGRHRLPRLLQGYDVKDVLGSFIVDREVAYPGPGRYTEPILVLRPATGGT